MLKVTCVTRFASTDTIFTVPVLAQTRLTAGPCVSLLTVAVTVPVTRSSVDARIVCLP